MRASPSPLLSAGTAGRTGQCSSIRKRLTGAELKRTEGARERAQTNGHPDEKSWAGGGSTAVAVVAAGGTGEGADDEEGERGTARPMGVAGGGGLRAAVLREGVLAGPAGTGTEKESHP